MPRNMDQTSMAGTCRKREELVPGFSIILKLEEEVSVSIIRTSPAKTGCHPEAHRPWNVD
jgi:hypothetical protein